MTTFEIGVDMFSKGFAFRGGETIKRAEGRGLPFLELNLDVVGTMWRELVKLGGSENRGGPRHVLGGNKVGEVVVRVMRVSDWSGWRRRGRWWWGRGRFIQVIMK